MRFSRCRPVLGAVGMSLALVFSLVACEPARPRAIVYGDSLVWESITEIRQWASARGYDVTIQQRFGGAPCSFYGQMQADRTTRPDAVILSFAGNPRFLEPCVGDNVAASYRDQMKFVKAIWTGWGADVTIALTPYIPNDVSETAQQAMKSEAHRQGLRVVDAGTYITPGRRWFWTQPCMAGERCVGHQLNRAVAPGRNIVRADDQTHFCPGRGHGFDPCRYYMSGAWRYARALTAPLSG